jgi:uncharacterized membrane protein
METYLFELASLLGRWLHIIVGIAWIGASFYFVWLDNHLLKPTSIPDGVAGEVWAVHGGGFYHSQKYRVAPTTLPGTLHWFYWEAYSTWLSGMFLMCLMYYARAELYLIDPEVAALSKPAAIALGLGVIVATWIIYDALCRSPLGGKDAQLGVAVALVLSLEAWLLCQLFSGRGAFIHFGAALGTLMVANVFFVIIPGQRELVRAKQEQREPEPIHGLRGKQRSVHNTYFTLPVLFTMISNHYANAFGARYNWLVLIVMCAASACIRGWFVARHKAHERGGRTSPILAIAGVVLLSAVAVALVPGGSSQSAASANEYARVTSIFEQRCVPCHSAKPTHPAFTAAPNGILLDTPERLRATLVLTEQQLRSRAMPLGNLTAMTEEERAAVLAWIEHGAPR